MKSEEVKNKVDKIQFEGQPLEEILRTVVSQYTGDLDVIMSKIDKDVISEPVPAITTIEKYFLELSSCLYYMCEQTEKLGVYDSLSKSKAQEVYNNSYLQHQYNDQKLKKPTVAELTALSEADALYDKTVNDIYSKAYKTVKNKVSSAETMVSTLSKILSHRIEESKLTTMQTSRQILNEEIVF